MQTRRRKYLSSLLFFLILLMSLNMAGEVGADKIGNRKAVVLIVDELSLEELLEADTPNLDSLIDRGGLGFMNSRAKSAANRGSRFLSLGMGVRTTSSSRGGWAFGPDEKDSILEYRLGEEGTSAKDLYELYIGKEAPEGELINLAIGDIDRLAYKATPNNEIGLLGRLARENDLTIGLVGNSDVDSISREAALIAMDERGSIPLGYVEEDLLVYDKSVLGNKRLDQDRMLEEVDRIIDRTDILFLDYGDTVRVEAKKGLALDGIQEEQKLMALERADSFLGSLMDRLDLENTMFILLSPNPSRNMLAEKNFGLTPFLMAKPGMEKGLLSSTTTRREGLVTNFDFAPTVLSYFDEKLAGDFIGEAMTSIAKEDSTSILEENYGDYLYLRRFRSAFHWAFIALVLFGLILLYLPGFIGKKSFSKKWLGHLVRTILALPLTMMTVSIFGYKNIVLDMAYVILGGFLLGYLLDRLTKKDFTAPMILSLATALLLLLDGFFIKKLMIISPLGSDAIAGGRFYGIGNDYMGILLGSTLLGLSLFYERYKLSNRSMMLITGPVLVLIIVGLSPLVGANMGGSLSAMIILFMAFLIILEREISIKKLVLVMSIVVLAILGLAGLDIILNPNPTHAGKAIEALFTGGGFGKLYEIISIKLRQVFWNIAYASWNIVLFIELLLVFLLYRYRKEEVKTIRQEQARLYKGFELILLGSLAIFLFNDTGTIAAALILIYLFIPLGMVLNDFELD